MATFRPIYFPESNRRRCVKGRSSFTESSDPSALSQDQSNGIFCQNDDIDISSVEPDDVEEEDNITIDLSAFLNDNPLLAQAAFESSAENNTASTETNSQFRFTHCQIDPSDHSRTDVSNMPCPVDINGTTPGDIIQENMVTPLTDSLAVHDNAKENSLSPEKVLTDVINSEPAQNIILNGNKSPISPLKKFCRARPLGLSNPLKKYKNFMKSKDLNKINETVFGKYPVVRCERLDIENFVKNNKIKVRNWPLLHTVNQKNQNLANKSSIKKPTNLTRNILKPKFIKKSINLNKCLVNSNKCLKQPSKINVKNTLDDHHGVSRPRPIIIKTDSWKPGVAGASPNVPPFFRNFISTSTPKTLENEGLKLNDQNPNFSIFASPDKEIGKRTNTFFSNVNNLLNSSKNYQLIAPKPILSSKAVAKNHTKPIIETLINPASDNFIVIQPYVEDPLSPQKPKPIITLPVELLATPEKQLSASDSKITPLTESSQKSLLSAKSVSLNGAIRQISIPQNIKRDLSIMKKDIIRKEICQENLGEVQNEIDQDNFMGQVRRTINQENLISKVRKTVNPKNLVNEIRKKIVQENVKVTPKLPFTSKMDALPGKSPDCLKAKNFVVDAMQNAFSMQKKNSKSRFIKKETLKIYPTDPFLGSSSYSSILNNNLLTGFGDNDFEDLFSFEDNTTNIHDDTLTPSKENSLDEVDVVNENSILTPRSIKTARKRKKYTDKFVMEESHDTTSTLSASECEIESNLNKESLFKRRKISSRYNFKCSISSTEVHKRGRKPNSTAHASADSVHSKNEPDNKIFDSKHTDSSLSLSSLENTTESHDNVNRSDLISSEIRTQPKSPDISNETCNIGISPIKKSKKQNDVSVKQETSTRTLRGRKCFSAEVDNLNKQSPHTSNSHEKTKIKGSINSKLKIQLKLPKSSARVKRKSNKPEDIIREINTITGGRSVSKITNKNKMATSNNSNDSNIDVENDSQSRSSCLPLESLNSSRSFTRKRKGRKVSIKRTKQQKKSSLNKSLNSLTDVVENANTSSVSESNSNLHSSFRETKGEKMGTPQKEEYSHENSTCIADCNMEVKTDGKLPISSQEPVENSEASSVKDAVEHPGVNDSAQNEPNSDKHEFDTKYSVSEDDKEPICENISNSPSENNFLQSSDSEVCDHLINRNSFMVGEPLLLNSLEKSEDTLPSASSLLENELKTIVSVSVNDNIDKTITCDTSESLTEGHNKDIFNTEEKCVFEKNVESAIGLMSEQESIIKAIVSEKFTDDDFVVTNHLDNDMQIEGEEYPQLPLGEPFENNLLKLIDEDNIMQEQNDHSDADIDHIELDVKEIISDLCNKLHCQNLPAFSDEFSTNSAELFDEEMIKESLENFSHDVPFVKCDVISDCTAPDLSETKGQSIENEESTSESADDKTVIKETNNNTESNNLNMDSCENLNEVIDMQKGEASVHLPSSEIASEQQLLSPERYVSELNKKSPVESKKCPKLKIFKKADGDSPDSLKNWFVSESREAEVDSFIQEEASESSKELPGLPPGSIASFDLSVINDSSKNISSLENKEDGVMCNSKTPFVDESSSLFSNENILTDRDRTLPENESSEKSRSSLNASKKECLLSVEEPISSLDESFDKGSNDLSVVIKEEPMDVEEIDLDSNSPLVPEGITIKTEPTEGTKKRGRPRKSIPSSVHLDIKSETTPIKQEAKFAATPKSTGRKKKGTPKSASILNSPGFRRKNYDPELVCAPFVEGWMREHVIRATGKDDKRPSDIYYFSPEGTKLRSMPDILAYLSKHPQMKLSAVNFTFAKELIYREPFEVERDAKQATRRVSVTFKKTPTKTPNKIPTKMLNKTPTKTPNKALVSSSVSKSSSPGKTPSDIKKKRKSSSPSKDNVSSDVLSSPSKIPKKTKQKSIKDFINENFEQSANKSKRPSRKIVKKEPFDNSVIETKSSKTPKPNATSTKNPSETINTKAKESLVLKLPIKLKTYSSSKESKSASELQNSNLPESSNSELVNKSAATTENVSNEGLLSRTSIKSSVIQNRLKVKLAPLPGKSRKSGLVSYQHCTKYCNFSYIREPTIKCCICLCLFHRECIPFKPTGLTKYACKPCVETQINRHADTSEDIFFPADFDIEILYPVTTMQILTDPVFDSKYNKFYSPVDHSFASTTVTNNSNVRLQQPPNVYGNQNVGYFMGKIPMNPLNASVPRQNTNLWYPPPNSCNIPSTAGKNIRLVATSVPIQRISNNPHQKVFVAGPGSLPLLQNFSNTFFHPNQSANRMPSNTSVNFPNSFSSLLGKDNSTLRPIAVRSSVDNSRITSAFLVQKLPVNSHTGQVIPSSNIQNTSGHTGSMSVLQSMLQAGNVPLNSSSENPLRIRILNNYSLSKGDKSNATLPDSTNNSPAPERGDSSMSNLSDSNKRKCDDGDEKIAKKIKCDQLNESNSSETLSSKDDVHKSNCPEQLMSFWDMNKFAQIYECLNFIFKFLNVSDLLCASLVCRSWRHLASQKLLWENVCFSGILVKDWSTCGKTLKKQGTKYIDFRGMHDQDSTDTWKAFCDNVKRFNKLEELIFEKVPPFVLKNIADNLPHLRRVTCYCLTSVFTEPEIWSTPCVFELSTLRCLGRLESLKISSMGGVHLEDNQQSLMPYLPNLTHLVLTGFKFSSYMNLECLSQMQQLITLELGDCSDIEPQIYGLLAQLTCLQNLCLQNGGDVKGEKLSEALLKMKRLKNLELMNFQVSCRLPEVLKKMDNLSHFSLWPDNRLETQQVNFNSYKAATSCTNLKRLIWGILTDDDTVPSTLVLKDTNGSDDQLKTLSFQELFQSLVKHYPGVKVELKCLPRIIWSEFCSTRNIT